MTFSSTNLNQTQRFRPINYWINCKSLFPNSKTRIRTRSKFCMITTLIMFCFSNCWSVNFTPAWREDSNKPTSVHDSEAPKRSVSCGDLCSAQSFSTNWRPPSNSLPLMAFYITRRASKVSLWSYLYMFSVSLWLYYWWFWLFDYFSVKVWRRICGEVALEIPLLAQKWKLLLAGLFFQVIPLSSEYMLVFERLMFSDCFWMVFNQIVLLLLAKVKILECQCLMKLWFLFNGPKMMGL